MRVNIILVILMLWLVSSCSLTTVQERGIDYAFQKCDSLRHAATIADDYIWGHPLAMQCLDSMIFVFDEKLENGMFHIVDCHNKNEVIDFGHKGQGNNEFIMPFDFQVVGDTALSIFDFAKKSLCLLNPDRLKHKDNLDYPILYKDTVPSTIKILPTRFTSFVTLGFYPDCMFKLCDRNGVSSYGEYPYKDEDERSIENRMRGMAYQGLLGINPSNDKFVYAVSSADIIFFYEINQKELSLKCKYEFNYPKYQVSMKGDTRSAPMAPDNRKTFISLSATDDFVYLLYAGYSFSDKGLKALEGNIVYVYDWNGTPVQKFLLDIPVTNISVANGKLYAFSNMPEPTLVAFDLLN
ncbi:BF3164 family lipoprotein [uncultured Bacteroides sp.]|nr:BF3164 family lipoprotein [uncultured Bacteroides sp.]